MGETTTGQGVLSALPDSTKQRVIECDWHGLYRAKWGRNRLQPESFAHPAKAAYGLAVRIAKYLLEQNYIRPGDLVLDPFGGIGGFALPLIERGVNVVLVELEQRFNDMAQGCECTGISKEDWIRFQGRYDKARYLDGRYWCPRCVMQAQTVPPRKFNPFKFTSDEWARWNDRGFHQPTLFGSVGSATYERNSGRIPFTGPHHYTGNLEAWNEAGYEGRAVMLQGDSRRLCDVLAGAGVAGAVSSPPYAGIATSSGQRLVGHGKAQLQRRWSEWHEDTDRYGETPGQLASLPEGDVPQVQAGAVVSSMPYANSLKQEGQFQKVGSPGYTGLKAMNDGYSRDPANLGNLPAGEPPAAIVSSMPFTNSLASDDPDKRGGLFRDPKRRGDRNMTGEYGASEGQIGAMREGVSVADGMVSSPPFEAVEVCQDKAFRLNDGRKTPPQGQQGYGQSDGQLGTESGTTFWEASAEIMHQVYQVLAPGAVAVWVCKAFVRSGQVVPFPEQWAALGEACGFETIGWIRCWLVEDRGAQYTLDGDLSLLQAAYKSFFRRLSEKRGSPEINFEVVVIQRKPGTLPGAQETEPGAEADTLEVLPLFAEVTSQ